MTGGTIFWDVDTQVDFMLPCGALPVPGAETTLANLGRLTAAARAAGITIVHTADVVEDAVAALDLARGADLLEDWRRRGVRVVSTDQVLLELGR